MHLTATRYHEQATSLVSALLLDIIDNSRQGDIALAESIGLEIGTINMLYKLKPEQLHSLSRTYTKNIISAAAFNIDAKKITNIINAAASESEMLDILDQYIINGASKLMIEDFFGVRSTQFATRKKILGVITNNKGRKKYITDDEKRDIYNSYLRTLDLKDERRRYLQVSIETKQTLHNVYTTLQEIKEIKLHAESCSINNQIKQYA